jgi:hypothetical protein
VLSESKSNEPEQQKGEMFSFSLKGHLDWISSAIAVLLGLLLHYANFHIPW